MPETTRSGPAFNRNRRCVPGHSYEAERSARPEENAERYCDFYLYLSRTRACISVENNNECSAEQLQLNSRALRESLEPTARNSKLDLDIIELTMQTYSFAADPALLTLLSAPQTGGVIIQQGERGDMFFTRPNVTRVL